MTCNSPVKIIRQLLFVLKSLIISIYYELMRRATEALFEQF